MTDVARLLARSTVYANLSELWQMASRLILTPIVLGAILVAWTGRVDEQAARTAPRSASSWLRWCRRRCSVACGSGRVVPSE